MSAGSREEKLGGDETDEGNLSQEQDGSPEREMANAVSMPVIPTVGFGAAQSSIDIVSRSGAHLVSQEATSDVQMFSQRDPVVSRLNNKGADIAMMSNRP